MAKTYSQDSRAENSGAWDWMERKQMKKSMADAGFALNGGVSQVIEEETSFIIIYCDRSWVTPRRLRRCAPTSSA